MSEIMLQAMEKLQRERDELHRETIEQCRLLGMGGERELKLLGEVERLKRELDEARTQEKWHFDNYVYTQELYNELREQMDALAKALKMVRDADNDCYSDGFQTIPPEIRNEIDEALAAVKGGFANA